MLSNIANFLNINKSDIKIPEFLQHRNIKDSDIPILKKFFKENNISNFSEITIDIVNQFAKYDYDKAIQVNTILGLYGVEFIGKSSKKYSPNSRNTISLLVSQKDLNLYETKLFQQNYKNLEIRFLEYFEKIGITSSEQITGINLSVLLDKLNIIDLNIEDLENDLNYDYFAIVKNNFEQFYTKKTNVKVEIEKKTLIVKDSVSIKNTDLTTRTVNCLLANGIDTIGKLQQLNIEEFRTRKNVGYKTIDEILSYLNSEGFENISFQEITITRDNIKNGETNLTINQPEEIDEKIYNLEINKLNLPQKIEEALNSKNITTVGKFIENVNLIELKSKEKDFIYEKLGVYGVNKYKKYIPKFIKTPGNYFLKISEVFQDDWIVSACKKYNLKNIGLLANVFPDIFGQDEDLVAQDIFFEKINYVENKLNELGISKTPIALSYFEKKELSKKDICELANENYIQQIEDIVVNILNNSQSYFITQAQLKLQLKDKELDVITRRYGINCSKQTLEEIGQNYGCTRERIRQLESKALKKISTLLTHEVQNINEDVIRLFKDFGCILSYPIGDVLPIDALIKNIMNNIKDRCFDIDYDNLCITKKGFKFENLQNEIIDSFDNIETSFGLSKIQESINIILVKYINNSTQEQKNNYLSIYNHLYSILLNNNFIKIDENLYKLISKAGRRSTQERDEKLIYWFKKLYPHGIHLPIEKEKEEQVKQSLQPLYENCEEIIGLNVRSVADRLIKYNKDVIWWGRGLYIHVDNIDIDWNVVDFAIEEVIKKFDNGLHRLKPRVIYEENKEKFISANIPNETALVGLIRFKNNPQINTKRDEIRDANNSNIELNILENFEQFILEYPNGINKKDLMFEMCNKRGWQKYQIEFLYSRSNLVYSDNGVYYHKNNLNINKDKLSEIISLIQKELNENNYPFLHLRKIKNKYPATWVGVLNMNISPSFMGRLINSELINNDIVIDNYVYVKKIEHSDENISMFNILSKFVEEKSIENKYVTLSEIIDYCQKQEIKDTKQPIVDCVLKFSYEYSDEVYVHKNALGYCEEFQEDIFALIQKLSETDFEMPIISYEDVIIEFSDFLPTLNDGYDWNIYLLRSALSSDENLDIFDKTFIFKDNQFGVEDLDDTAAYLIMKNCENGYCKFKELDKLMARYGITPYKNLHFYKSRLFFEGSSIKSVDNDTAVAVEKFARDKYLNV